MLCKEAKDIWIFGRSLKGSRTKSLSGLPAGFNRTWLDIAKKVRTVGSLQLSVISYQLSVGCGCTLKFLMEALMSRISTLPLKNLLKKQGNYNEKLAGNFAGG